MSYAEDPDRANEDRVRDVAKMFRESRAWNENDAETNLADLLGDLMHWAEAKGASFQAALIRARGYYTEEAHFHENGLCCHCGGDGHECVDCEEET